MIEFLFEITSFCLAIQRKLCFLMKGTFSLLPDNRYFGPHMLFQNPYSMQAVVAFVAVILVAVVAVECGLSVLLTGRTTDLLFPCLGEFGLLSFYDARRLSLFRNQTHLCISLDVACFLYSFYRLYLTIVPFSWRREKRWRTHAQGSQLFFMAQKIFCFAFVFLSI